MSSQISQRPARSRWISSLRRALAMTGRWSVRTAVRLAGELAAPQGKPACFGPVAVPLARWIAYSST